MKINTVKSIGAIVAGFVVVAALSIGVDFIFNYLNIPSKSVVPTPTWFLILAFIYRSIFTVAGGYVTALVAPINKMRHVVVLGILGVLGGIAGVIGGWNLSDHWYPVALAISAFPLIYVGGWLYTRRTRSTEI
jgi:hypothetical protein